MNEIESYKPATNINPPTIAPKSPGVYVIFNSINKKVYIGASKNLYLRIASHKSNLARGRHPNESMLEDWTNHGSDSFIFSVVPTSDLESAFELEKELIEKSFGDGCYNKVDFFGIGWKENPIVNKALADIDLGMTAYAAAKKHGVQQSSLSRALKRRANVCPCCGQQVNATK